MITFSNPRLHAEFNDWPSGSRRVKCTFHVEHHSKHGWRVTRQTEHYALKKTAYGGKPAIVDGSDGRTYLLQIADMYNFITIYSSDLRSANTTAFGGSGSDVVFASDVSLYATLKSLIDAAHQSQRTADQ